MNDIIIIGAGIIGASIARNLAKYNLNILVLEKNSDVGDGASGANSGLIHSGYDPLPNTLMARLNVLGNKMYDQICDELDIKLKRCGSITLAHNEEEVEVLKELYKRGIANGVDVELLDGEELAKKEKNITSTAIMGLFAKSCAIINPFEAVVKLMENAMDNNVKLNLNEEVIDIKRVSNYFLVVTNKSSYKTKWVINASGVYADKINELVNPKSFTITPKRGEYYVLDHYDDTFLTSTLFSVPSSNGKGVLVTPTTSYNYLVGPSSDVTNEKDDVKTHSDVLDKVREKAKALVDHINYSQTIREFSGVRSISDTNDFYIKEESPNFINVAGISSPGLSSAPAIAEMVAEMIPSKKINPSFKPTIKPQVRLKELNIEERNKLIKTNPLYGRIVCRCEEISEQEVIDCIRRNCGATTVKGVKKRVRPGFGKCQGGFCEPLIMKILQKELGKDLMDINYANEGSFILLKESKGQWHE